MDLETLLLKSLLPWLLRAMRHMQWDDYLSAIVIWRLWRRTRYLTEALRRSNERNLREQNEIVKRLLKLFTTAPPPRLRDLVNDTGNDWPPIS